MRKITEMQEKFTKFYKRYQSLMYYIANDVLKDSHAAEDAVQIAFMNIYRNFQGVGDIESAQTKHFVVTVTRRVAIDFYRQQQRQNARKLSLEEYEEEASAKQAEMVTEDNEVIKCIRRIPSKYADVLILRYVQGYKTKEIASLFGNTQGTIRSYLFRGKRLLRKELKKSGIDIRI